MSKITFKLFYLIIMGMVLAVAVVVSAGAPDDEKVNDKVELKNGDEIIGTVLTDTFTITTPYTAITLERDKIAEISINSEREDHDVVELKEGGLLEGTIEEQNFSFKTDSGKIISIEKEECKKIVLK